MGIARAPLTELDGVYLERAYELARRGIGNTSPNPPVGAVIVAGETIVGEGYHHRAGTAHAETNALVQAGERARGATAYVSLEPCNHEGRTPACTRGLIDAGIARVVLGTIDPNPKTNGQGAAFLRGAGVSVDVADDARARELIEIFAGSVDKTRPYVSLKMAMSLDGAVAARPGVTQRITSEDVRLFVRDLRIAHDAVMVGAGTIRVDDPMLTVRPPHHRLRPFVRVVVCETDAVPENSRVFAPLEDYAKTIVLAPGGLRARFAALSGVADVVFAGDGERLNLTLAMEALRERNVYSALCEGGPTLAAQLISARLADRFYWAVGPLLLGRDGAIPVLSGVDFSAQATHLRFDRVEQVGDDVVISGAFDV